MKQKWTKPQMQLQEFAANEYIAACYRVQCNVWNVNQDGVKIGEYRDSTSAYDLTSYALGKDYCEDKLLWHSKDACGLMGNNIVSDDGTMYEKSSDHGDLTARNVNINWSSGVITWYNQDPKDESRKWYHTGKVYLDDPNKPNHS